MSTSSSQIRLSPEQFQAVLDAVHCGVFTIDRDFVITSFNEAAEQITGRPRAEVLGRRCRDVFRTSACEQAGDCPMELVMNTGCVISSRVTRIEDVEHHSEKLIELSFSPLRDQRGQIVGGVKTLREVPARVNGRDGGEIEPLPILEASERRAIEDVLRRHRGNKTATSKELGISRITLWRKMRKLGIEGAEAS